MSDGVSGEESLTNSHTRDFEPGSPAAADLLDLVVHLMSLRLCSNFSSCIPVSGHSVDSFADDCKPLLGLFSRRVFFFTARPRHVRMRSESRQVMPAIDLKTTIWSRDGNDRLLMHTEWRANEGPGRRRGAFGASCCGKREKDTR